MQIYTSYFYQIRYFRPYMIPLSTAVWDPKWFHLTKDKNTTYIDKRGVINGVRFEEFVPDSSCINLCRGRDNCAPSPTPNTCKFLENYEIQLNKYSINEIFDKLIRLSISYKNLLKLDKNPILVLVVYEDPENPCSERKVIQNYFMRNGIRCKELLYPIENNYYNKII